MRQTRTERRSIGRPAELRLSTRQVYNLLARYRVDRRVSSLLPRTNGARKKRLDPEVEEIIAATLRAQWLTLEAPPLAPVVAEIRARCEEAGLAAPSYSAVDRRIPSLFSPEEIAKKRSANPKHLLRLKPRPGYIRASKPLEVCQIDHTPTDIHFVEVVDGRRRLRRQGVPNRRRGCGDALHTRLLPDPRKAVVAVRRPLPRAGDVPEGGMAGRRAASSDPWPMFGRPRLLVTDSAKEFKGRAFQRGCEDYGIRIRYRDRGRVHEGGRSRTAAREAQWRTRDAPGVGGSICGGPRRLSRGAARSAEFRRSRAVRRARRDRPQSAAECEDVEDAVGGMGAIQPRISRGSRTIRRGSCWRSCPGRSGAFRRKASACSRWTIIRHGWAAWSRGATVWVGSRCDTTPATSATSMSGIRKRGSFGRSDGAMGGSRR